MTDAETKIQQLQAAIGVQESLRPVLGDPIVDVTVAALRGQIEALQSEVRGADRANRGDGLLELLQRYLPRELAEKMRALGRIEGERKQVTVLFADLSGFTDLAERLDAEELTMITNAVLEELAGAVYEFEGYIDKFIGDAVMAVFGAPIAHENDPERALRAALSMRKRLAEFNRRWRERLDEPLTLHIGVNTGMVIAGNVGSDMRLSYTIMGDTVNTASRLETVARPGQILVSHSTHRLTEDAFAFVALEPIRVKGKREPLVVYALEHARLTPGKTRGLKEFRRVFVERERELAALGGLDERLQRGRGSVVVVTGEAGIGKSRLMAEWRTGLPSTTRWLEGRCFPHTTSLPYGPFVDLLLRHAALGDEVSEDVVRRRLEAIVERLSPGSCEAQALFASMLALQPTDAEDALLAAMPAERRRRRLFELVQQWLTDLAGERPVVLVFEDTHWIDAASAALVQSLLSAVHGHPVILVSVSRGPQGETLSFHDHVARHPDHVLLLPLAAISEEGSVAMVQELLRTPALPDPLRHAVLRKAEGNPFFIEEVLRMLVERAALVRAPGGDDWVATELLDAVQIPDTLHGVLMARIDRLDPETRWVVQQASVIGRIFLYRVLSRLAASEHLDADIGLLERDGLIRERSRQPDLEYMFQHALTQEVAYQSLLAPRRKELHRRVGLALEAVFADRLAEYRPVIGRHFLLGEAWAEAVDYLTRSGAAAARLYAHVEARTHFGDALKALEHLPVDEVTDRMAIDLAVDLARVSQVADDPGINVGRLTLARARAEQLVRRFGGLAEDRRRLARVELHEGISLSLRGDDMAAAIACFERVLPVAQEFQDEELLAVSSTSVAKTLVTAGMFRDALPLLRDVVHLLARRDDLTEWILTTVFVGLTEAAVGDWRAGERTAEQALACAVEIHNNTGQIYGHLFLSVIAVHTGDMKRVLAESQRALQLAEAAGERMYCYFSHAYLALAHSHLGDPTAADASLARQRVLAAGLGGTLATADWFAAFEAEVALNAGRTAEALALAEAALVHAKAVGGVYGEGLARRVHARALVAAGLPRREAIDASWEASVECFRRGGAALELARTLTLWGAADPAHGEPRLREALALYEHFGRTEEAAQLRARLDPRL